MGDRLPRPQPPDDDVIVHSADADKHVDLLDKTLQAHFQAGIRLKAKKTILFEDAVDYLGFRISAEGIGMTEKYVQQIRDCPQPKSGKELASALGFFGYYREFMKLFPVLTAEMNKLKAKKKWDAGTWTKELQEEFQQLKKEFLPVSGVVREHPMSLGEEGAREYILTTDWSKQALVGAQIQHGQERFLGAQGRKCRPYE